jgi:anti-sigma factor RsiW
MACERYRGSMHELVDGTIGPIRRAELQQHLDTCDACRALLADLQFVRDSAASLEPLAPPDGVWLQVAGRLRQEGRVAPLPAAPPASTRRYAVLAIAAALILTVGASIMVLLRSEPGPAPNAAATTAGNAAAEDPVQGIAEEIRLAEMHYQNAIGRLEQVAKLDAATGETTIDPQTVATLQKSLSAIDLAIAESRSALRTEPQNAPARDSLFDALKRKVVLLQDTVVLMNAMRTGNSAGAAQIVDGLNKS